MPHLVLSLATRGSHQISGILDVALCFVLNIILKYDFVLRFENICFIFINIQEKCSYILK